MANTYELISSVTVGAGGAANIDFTSIPATYTDLCLLISAKSTQASVADSEAYIKFNNSTSSYSYRLLAGSGTTVGSANGSSYPPIVITASGSTSNTFASSEIYIPNYAGSTNKSLSINSSAESNITNIYTYLVAGLWSNTSAINQITLTPLSGNFVQYSTAYLYGIKNS